jgi:predicted  nucleic acid-binding Zn-ribbon protein
LEHQRLVQELEDLEKSASSFDIVVRERQTELEKVNTAVQSMETDVKDLRELDDARKIWTADAMRIALQRDTVNQKEADFQLMNSDVKGRDLKQVEAELLDMSSKKDEYTDKITKLNAELTTINDRVSNYSITATRLENQLRSMEAKYEEELKNDERKDELNKKYAEMKAEQDTLSNQIAPLNQRIETKDSYKTRARKLAEEEENRFSSTLASFNNDVTALQNIVDSIEDYDKSNSQDDMEKIEEEKKKLIDKSKAKMEELKKLRPDIKRLADIVDNQQQQKQNLEGNITLVQSLQKIKLYNNEMAEIEAELSQHESFSSLQADLQSLGKQNNGLIESKARLEGRRGEVIDNQRALKRKLQAKEYRDVEEQFRKASIRQDTTGKCYGVLDNIS